MGGVEESGINCCGGTYAWRLRQATRFSSMWVLGSALPLPLSPILTVVDSQGSLGLYRQSRYAMGKKLRFSQKAPLRPTASPGRANAARAACVRHLPEPLP